MPSMTKTMLSSVTPLAGQVVLQGLCAGSLTLSIDDALALSERLPAAASLATLERLATDAKARCPRRNTSSPCQR